MSWPENNWITAAQIIFGIVVIILLYVITLVILNIDAIVANKNITVRPRETTVIVDGYAGSNYLADRSFNTINPFTDNFVKIGKSINTHGGAQFTYQMWIKMEDQNAALYRNRILILKGDKDRYNIGYYNPTSPFNKVMETLNECLIKCPLIRFGNSYNELVIELNTNRNIHYTTTIKMDPGAEATARRNALSLLPLNWYLFTFIFEDNFSAVESTENGIRISFYMNDFPYHIVNASADPVLRNNFIKQNEGDFHILPDLPEGGNFLKLANIKYYNYALTQKDISKHFANGPPKYAASFAQENIPKPAYLTAYNKMDIYNY